MQIFHLNRPFKPLSLSFRACYRALIVFRRFRAREGARARFIVIYDFSRAAAPRFVLHLTGAGSESRI